MDLQRINTLIRDIPDFPKPGILFKDIFPLFQDPIAVEMVITHIVNHINTSIPDKVDVIVGLDARGFLFGPLIAMRLGAAFAPVRKAGKLPGGTIQVSYVKEYGTVSYLMAPLFFFFLTLGREQNVSPQLYKSDVAKLTGRRNI